MRLHIGRPRALLVIAPHPDDETIGALGLMALARRRGIAVRVLIVSDGCGSHRGSRRWPPDRLRRERERETRAAVRRIGVVRDDVRFLRFPDGMLAAFGDQVDRSIGRAMRCAPRPLLVVAPGAGDDHADHRTVADAVGRRRIPGVRRLAYPVWPAGRRFAKGRGLMLGPQHGFAKRLAIRRYRTQAGRITDDPHGFTMTARQIAAFARPTETFIEF